jgi:hypothetical protein
MSASAAAVRDDGVEHADEDRQAFAQERWRPRDIGGHRFDRVEDLHPR